MTCDRTGFTSKTISLSPSLVVFASSYRRTPFTLNGNGNDKQLDLTGNRVIRRGTLNIQFAMLTVDSLLIFCMQSSAQLCLYLIKNNYTIMHLIIKLFEICNSVSKGSQAGVVNINHAFHLYYKCCMWIEFQSISTWLRGFSPGTPVSSLLKIDSQSNPSGCGAVLQGHTHGPYSGCQGRLSMLSVRPCLSCVVAVLCDGD